MCACPHAVRLPSCCAHVCPCAGQGAWSPIMGVSYATQISQWSKVGGAARRHTWPARAGLCGHVRCPERAIVSTCAWPCICVIKRMWCPCAAPGYVPSRTLPLRCAQQRLELRGMLCCHPLPCTTQCYGRSRSCKWQLLWWSAYLCLSPGAAVHACNCCHAPG